MDTHLKSRTPCKREQLKPQQQQNSLQFTPPSFILERGFGMYCKQGAPKNLDNAYNWVNNQSWTNAQTNSRLSVTSLFWKCQNLGCTIYCKRSNLFAFWSPQLIGESRLNQELMVEQICAKHIDGRLAI